MGADAFEPHLFENAGNAVALRRSGGERQVDDAEGNVEARGGRAADKFAGPGDLESRAPDDRGEGAEIDITRGLDRAQYDAGTADANIHHTVGLAGAVKGSSHERVILDCIAEYDQLGTADGLTIGR